MCRYAFSGYKTSWVCVPCRHVAQYAHPGDAPGMAPRCPSCSQPLTHAGRDFQAPRKRDSSGWAAVAGVLGSGQGYDSCGCTGPGKRPRTKAEARRIAMEARRRSG